MYRIAKVIDARDYKGNPDKILTLMADMKNEMLKKFGTIYDDELMWHIHVSVCHEMQHYLSNFLQARWGDEEFLGSKIVVEDFPLSASIPQITLEYNQRKGDYRMGDFIKRTWDELCVMPYHSNIMPRIKKVIFNSPATIVYWSDNTKTVVKCGEGDIYDEEKGLAMAICKKLVGLKEFYKQYNKAIDEVYERKVR